MKDLHPQFELLINYADGNADADMQKQAVELIESDADAADFYQSLRATALSCDDINHERQTEEVPQHIVDQIESATPASVQAIATESSSDDKITSLQIPATMGSAPAGTNATNAEPAGYGKLALVASLFCGLVTGALLYSVSGDSTGSRNSTEVSQADGAVPAVPEWVRLVADYHRLYVRETVAASAVSSAEVVSKQVAEVLQTDFSVPSLEQQGMEFRRAQWLAIDDQPLLQLAYLPESGMPLAVCILKKDTRHDLPAEYGETGGMQYVHWQSGEHAVVIVGTVSPQQLQDINGIVERELL